MEPPVDQGIERVIAAIEFAVRMEGRSTRTALYVIAAVLAILCWLISS